MQHEIEVLEATDFVQALRKQASAHETYSERLGISFGTQAKGVIFFRNKAVGYRMLADVIEADIKSRP